MQTQQKDRLSNLAGTVLISAASLLAGASALAQPVVISTKDKSMVIQGELLSYDGTTYEIATSIGTIQVEAQNVLCTGDACPQVGLRMTDFSISGSTSLNERLVPELLQAFADVSDGFITSVAVDGPRSNLTMENEAGETAQVSLTLGGSSSGISDLSAGRADLAVATRQITSSEERPFLATGVDLADAGFETILALDALVFVTSPKNPVRSISEDSVARVFAGEITNWSQLGGPDAKINLYIRPENTATGALFSQLLMIPRQLRLSRDAERVNSDLEIASAVVNDPLGIGFTNFSTTAGAKPLALRGDCGIQTPTNVFTIKTEEYPYTRRLYFYRKPGDAPALAEQFVDYLRTEDAQSMILANGYVDLGVSDISLNEQGLRLAVSVLPGEEEFDLLEYQNMVRQFLSSYRSSITLRFQTGSTNLDTRAQTDIKRLADLIIEGAYQNKEIILAGFSDSVGVKEVNRSLSQARAEEALNALMQELPAELRNSVPVSVLGYGELSPLGCNETLSGRQINRRVEVWTRDLVRN